MLALLRLNAPTRLSYPIPVATHGSKTFGKPGHSVFFGSVIAARQSLQSMISVPRLFSTKHLRRAGHWMRLSTSGVLSDQNVWDAPYGFSIFETFRGSIRLRPRPPFGHNRELEAAASGTVFNGNTVTEN